MVAGLGLVVWPRGSVEPGVPPQTVMEAPGLQASRGIGSLHLRSRDWCDSPEQAGSSWGVSQNEPAPEDLNHGLYFLFKEKAVSDWGSGLHKHPQRPQQLGPLLRPGAAERARLGGGSSLCRCPAPPPCPLPCLSWWGAEGPTYHPISPVAEEVTAFSRGEGVAALE